jgi:hypothetical protein
MTRITLGEECKKSCSLCSLLHSPGTPSLLGLNILLRTLFSNTLSLCPSSNVRGQISHPYKVARYPYYFSFFVKNLKFCHCFFFLDDLLQIHTSSDYYCCHVCLSVRPYVLLSTLNNSPSYRTDFQDVSY